MRNLWYFVKEALNNSQKNFSTTFGAIITIFLSLLVIGVFLMASILINAAVENIESTVSIRIFVHDDATQDNIHALTTDIEAIPDVASVTFYSKEESLEQFKETSTTEIIDGFGGNPLPAKMAIELSDPEKVQEVVDQIIANPVYMKVIDRPNKPDDSIRYGKQVVENIFLFADIVRIVCIALVLLLVLVALIFINNTIRLAILARRKEIAIMRLVGASNGFIRGPFLMEGALQAIIGAVLAAGVIAILVSTFLPMLTEMMPWLFSKDVDLPLLQINIVLLAAGLIIGLFGSLFAMRRYLKV